MKRVLGLRTEIILSSGLLVGAALLFMTFLLLRLTESRLLDQAIKLHTDHSTALSLSVEQLPELEMAQVVEHYARHHKLLHWRLVDQRMMPIAMSTTLTVHGRSQRELRYALLRQSPQIHLSFPSTLNLWPNSQASEQYVEITTSIHRYGATYALQLRYPLHNIFEQLLGLTKLAALFCFGYGLILVLTAILLLNPSVIRPVTLLTRRALQITDGDLSQRAPESGPREITELGSAFNQMVDSLQNSLEEQRHHYRKLQETHEELKQTRQHLAHSERIASIGNLTSGIAHELGNPLSASIGYLELLKKRCEEPKNRDLIERALNESHRMDQLIKDLLDFAAPDHESGHANCAPSDVLKHSCDMLLQQGALKERHLSTDWPEQLSHVSIPPIKLQQVLVNLILNARDATDSYGAITITATENDSKITIKVEDNGHGIEEQSLETIFDPFYTTKAPGKGRGLGLYVSYQLVHDARGELQATSTQGKGSCFTVTLPIIPGES
ncbi:HAMP domain-containing sensor histidine kinase [Desulfuromonas acetoxidans]|uniref:sensor histidine kinase n=1 Tax=Desulfuromonas acetoxidans TaxID=891 RepID=UPI00292CE964|nr:HAMP domain-containing sensor histidine kinase [Desulfuromonas acetoxidans]